VAARSNPAVASLAESLERRTREGILFERLEGERVRCVACGHRCVVLPGLSGICRVRVNRAGRLLVPHGYVAGIQLDPIEKKPFFHAFPGATALSFGMLGCDLHCGYCQNWLTSQALRDPAALAGPRDVEPEDLVRLARGRGAQVLVTTYNEPLITAEWAVTIFREAKSAGITCGFVSNGNATPEVLDFLRPWVDLYKVDLKGFRDEHYRSLGGKLHNVLDSIEGLVRRGFWVEIVTLLIPGFNDDPAEIRDLTRFVASVSPTIPWHVTAFHGDYKMGGTRDTSADDLKRAAAIGREQGLRFVYAGNRPGEVLDLEDTRCAACGATVVSRTGYRITGYGLDDAGACLRCGSVLPGVLPAGWRPPPGDGGLPGRRPRPIATWGPS
jgi:pyruvate formate lyase activating enzyme